MSLDAPRTFDAIKYIKVTNELVLSAVSRTHKSEAYCACNWVPDQLVRPLDVLAFTGDKVLVLNIVMLSVTEIQPQKIHSRAKRTFPAVILFFVCAHYSSTQYSVQYEAMKPDDFAC